jgi:hypothetical protein
LLGKICITYASPAARSIAAMSILIIVTNTSTARRARFESGSLISSMSRVDGICQKTPHRSLSQPQAISEPPFVVSAAQSRCCRPSDCQPRRSPLVEAASS